MDADVDEWEYLGRSLGGDGFKIEGVNVWSHDWIDKRQKVEVLDRYIGESHLADIYEIVDGRRRICFATDERTPAVWAFYRPPKVSQLFDDSPGHIYWRKR